MASQVSSDTLIMVILPVYGFSLYIVQYGTGKVKPEKNPGLNIGILLTLKAEERKINYEAFVRTSLVKALVNVLYVRHSGDKEKSMTGFDLISTSGVLFNSVSAGMTLFLLSTAENVGVFDLVRCVNLVAGSLRPEILQKTL